MGYSASSLSGETLAGAQYNVMAALNGKVPGIQITSPSGNLGGSQRILIRGVNSLTGNNLPLFVVEGIPMNNAKRSDFNPNQAGTHHREKAGCIDPLFRIDQLRKHPAKTSKALRMIKDMCVPSQNDDQMTVSSDFVFVWVLILIHFERVPNADFDVVLYQSNSPVVLTMKTSLRERYKLNDQWAAGRATLLYAQYFAKTNYTDEDRYQIRTIQVDQLWTAPMRYWKI